MKTVLPQHNNLTILALLFVGKIFPVDSLIPLKYRSDRSFVKKMCKVRTDHM